SLARSRRRRWPPHLLGRPRRGSPATARRTARVRRQSPPGGRGGRDGPHRPAECARHQTQHRSLVGPGEPVYRTIYPPDTRFGQADQVSYLLRVVLPDRPGVLGAVATALGEVGADILSVDVIERSPGFAVDDLVLELPSDRLADSLLTAAASVDGVRVESIRPYAGVIDPHRELELLEALAASPVDSAAVLADGVARIFRAGWALVLSPTQHETAEVSAASVAAPEIATL